MPLGANEPQQNERVDLPSPGALAERLLWAFAGRLIYHDNWTFNFPILAAVSRDMACRFMPDWRDKIGSDTPLALYSSTSTLTNPFRIAWLFLTSCVQPGVEIADYLYKIHIFSLYLTFVVGMYVMGCVPYRHILSAVYLSAATLFAGLCMESMHSDQTTAILFWLPRIVTCVGKFHRARYERQAHWYLNAAVMLTALQALDQAPHFTAFAARLALVLYAALEPQAVLDGVRLHGKRLRPAAIVLLLTAAHLHYLLSELGHYTPSLRYAATSHAEMRLDLANLSETGFAQPSAFLGSFLPLTFIRAFDSLADGLHAWYAGHLLAILSPERRFFVYQLDAVMFFVGIIPTLLAAAFLMQPGAARRRAGWGLFALGSFLAALQQSRLYLLIFELPFFNLFRSYLLVALFGIFAVLVMSGYGVDALLTLEAAPRRRLAGRALALTSALAVVATLVFLWLFTLPVPTVTLPAARFTLPEPNVKLRYAALVGASMLASGLGVLAWAVYAAADVRRGISVVILVLALSHADYQAYIYRFLSIQVDEGIARFGLDEIDRRPMPQAAAVNPGALTRKLRTIFAQCYLCLRDTASLRLDHEGTFFRSSGEAVFQPSLKRNVVEALSAVVHPIFWTSRCAVPYANAAAELTRELNGHAADISERLNEVVHVRREDIGRLGQVPDGEPATILLHLARGADWTHRSYRAKAPFCLNAAIANFRHWRITVGGKVVRALRGNFGGIVILVPAGLGEIEFRYVNRASELFFATRLLMGSWDWPLWRGLFARELVAALRRGWSKLPDLRSRTAKAPSRRARGRYQRIMALRSAGGLAHGRLAHGRLAHFHCLDACVPQKRKSLRAGGVGTTCEDERHGRLWRPGLVSQGSVAIVAPDRMRSKVRRSTIDRPQMGDVAKLGYEIDGARGDRRLLQAVFETALSPRSP